MENIMENCIILNSLKQHFFSSIAMMEKIIEICPREIWNKKASGFVFWQQLLHPITGGHYWLRNENMEFIEPFKEKNTYSMNLEKEPENMLTKDNIKECYSEFKENVEKWFLDRDDSWLKSPFFVNPPLEKYKKITNFNIIMDQIKHFDYHIGHCEAIFRENNIDPGKYVWGIGEYVGYY
jgi:hypothetical protein